jgi:hypothetical protein
MIISGFPGVGKTTFAKKFPNLAVDLESSEFHYDLTEFRKLGLSAEQMKGLSGRVEKENWEKDYAEEAVRLNSKYKFKEKERLFGEKCEIIQLSGDTTLEDLLFSNEFKSSHD